ncbi:hypothetical protein [Klebsiella pneumoniae IS22]|nr:hypothetical protein [Klebsiella pneumoniae IS22]
MLVGPAVALIHYLNEMCQSTETAVNDAFCRTLTREVWLFRNAILFRNGLRMLDF